MAAQEAPSPAIADEAVPEPLPPSPGSELFAPLPPIPDDVVLPASAPPAADAPIESAPSAADAPIEAAPEIGSEAAAEIDVLPVAPVDPALVAPLPPLGGFDIIPDSSFQFTDSGEEGLRYRVQVEGLDGTGLEGEFRRLSALQRGVNRSATLAQVAARSNSDRLLLGRLLHSAGWYAGETETSMTTAADGRMEVRFSVLPGARYHWSSITLDLIPDDRPDLAEGFGLHTGEPIRADAVEEAEGELLRKLRENGFPFAEIGVRDVVLSESEPTGSYFLTGDIGASGVFGPIRIDGFQPFSAAHAAVIARFREGDTYDARLLDDFRRALIATQQFGGVTVSAVDGGERDAEGHAITEVRVAGNPGPQRLLSGQAGYASREGFRLEGAWRHRSLLTPEGAFTSRIVLGTEEQRLASDLQLSNWHQRDRTLFFGAGVANLTPPAYKAQTLDLRADLTRLSTPIWQKRWTWSVGGRFGISREQQKVARSATPDPLFDERRIFLFATLPTMLGYDRSDDLFDPTKGFRLKLEAEPEISRQGARIATYGRIFLGGSAYQRIGSSFVLAGMARAGTILGASLNDISLTRRLYAGGGGSVRGYSYQGLGIDESGTSPAGGRSLVEGSVEGRYRFGDFGAAVFVDGGAVSPDSMPGVRHMRFGAGAGVRYYTSFGPIRFDIARAIDRRPTDPKIAVYVSIGQAF